MANHPRRNWRKKWTIDLATQTATHQGGFAISFARGSAELVPSPQAIEANLAGQVGLLAAKQMITRLSREGIELYEMERRHVQGK